MPGQLPAVPTERVDALADRGVEQFGCGRDELVAGDVVEVADRGGDAVEVSGRDPSVDQCVLERIELIAHHVAVVDPGGVPTRPLPGTDEHRPDRL